MILHRKPKKAVNPKIDPLPDWNADVTYTDIWIEKIKYHGRQRSPSKNNGT